MKGISFLKKTSLKNKLILAFFSLVFFSIILVGLSSGAILINYSRNNILESRKSLVIGMLDTLEEKLKFIDDQIYNISWKGDGENSKLLTQLELERVMQDCSRRFLKEFQDSTYMSVFGSVNQYMEYVFIIGKNGLRLYNIKPLLYEEQDYEYYTAIDAVIEADFKDGKLHWFFSEGDIGQCFLPLRGNDQLHLTGIRKLHTWQYRQGERYKELGYIVYKLKDNFFSEYPSKMGLFADEAIVIMDGKGKPFFLDCNKWTSKQLLYTMENVNLEGNGIYPATINGKKANILFARSNKTGLGIALFKSSYSIQKETLKLLVTIGVIVISMLLISVILAIFISGGITKPLNNIIHKMNEVGKGNFNIYINEERQDEMGVLAHHYNLLVRNIQNLFKKEKESQLKIRKAELKTLQAQINPHFLYNTLDMICNKLLQAGHIETGELLMSFSNFFRLSLNEGRDLTTVGNELKHVENYLKLQKARYDNAFDYKVLIEDEVSQHFCLLFIVQPLVENALIHGIMKGELGAYIQVSAKIQGKNLVIEVLDDGVGFNPEKMKLRLGHKAQEQGSYGLWNIQERIGLYYGKGYGLEFDTGKNAGALVRVRLPLIVKSMLNINEKA